MTTVTSLMECLFQCANDVGCLAINYREDLLQGNMTENCELIETIEVNWSDELLRDVRYRFYMIIQNNLQVYMPDAYCYNKRPGYSFSYSRPGYSFS